MRTSDAQLINLGYDFEHDLYVAVFQVRFHLVNETDTISEFPGYDELEERADMQADALLNQEAGGVVEIEEGEVGDVRYELRAPIQPQSWGIIQWTIKRYYRPEALEAGAIDILDWWQRATQHAQLMGHLMEKSGNITWANDLVLRQMRHV